MYELRYNRDRRRTSNIQQRMSTTCERNGAENDGLFNDWEHPANPAFTNSTLDANHAPKWGLEDSATMAANRQIG